MARAKMLSSISGLFRRMSQFPTTGYLATCCTELDAAQEYASDQFLVVLIRMQCLIERAATVIPPPEADGTAASFCTPVYMTMSTIRNELESLKSRLPCTLQENSKVALNIREAKR